MDHNPPMILVDQAVEMFDSSTPTDPPQVDVLLSMLSGQENCNGTGSQNRRDGAIGDGKKMKIIHRDVERQRRQEMNALYGSLRSQLPSESLKGKRSIADHMTEAVKYIKHLENNIKELTERRDELKRQNVSQNHRNKASSSFSTKSDEEEDTVSVSSCGVGLEISINTAYEAPEQQQQQRISLGRVLRILRDEGLNVISCSSVKVLPRLLHSIHCEITDAVKINVPELQLKIENLREPN